MDLTNFPQTLSASNRAPSITEWNELRSYVTDSYKKKQHTARMIIEELSRRGFIVTDKVLRSKFKKWGIDDKNRRKGQDAVSSSRADSSMTSGEGQDSDSTARGCTTRSKSSPAHQRVVEVAAQPDQEERTADSTAPTQGFLHDNIQTRGSEPNKIIEILRNTKEHLHMQRILKAVGDWCAALTTPALQPRSGLSMNCPMIELSNDLHLALRTVSRPGTTDGLRMLKTASSKIHHALQYHHPATIAELLLLLSHLQELYRQNKEIQKPVMAVLSCMQRLAQEHLASEHPATLIILAFIQGRISADMCDQIFVAIDLSYTSKLGKDREDYVESRLTLTLGWMLLVQRRYHELERVLGDVIGGLTSFTADPYQEAEAYRILARSRSKRGRLAEANVLLSRAWTVLERVGQEASGTAHHLLLDLAQGKWAIDELKQCEDLLQKLLVIADRRKQELNIDISYVFHLLKEVYLKQGKKDLASKLGDRYSESLK